MERVGGDRTIPVDVRVIVATHRNLHDLVKKGVFREDLYHRIYVFPLLLPPLRERDGEIPALVAHFAAQVCEIEWLEAQGISSGGHPGTAALLVAGQCAGTAQCGGAPAAAGGRRGGRQRWCASRCPPARQMHQPRAVAQSGTARRAHGRLRARADSGGVEAQSSADDRYRQGAGAGAKPPVQEVPGTGNRSAGHAERGSVKRSRCYLGDSRR